MPYVHVLTVLFQQFIIYIKCFYNDRIYLRDGINSVQVSKCLLYTFSFLYSNFYSLMKIVEQRALVVWQMKGGKSIVVVAAYDVVTQTSNKYMLLQ